MHNKVTCPASHSVKWKKKLPTFLTPQGIATVRKIYWLENICCWIFYWKIFCFCICGSNSTNQILYSTLKYTFSLYKFDLIRFLSENSLSLVFIKELISVLYILLAILSNHSKDYACKSNRRSSTISIFVSPKLNLHLQFYLWPCSKIMLMKWRKWVCKYLENKSQSSDKWRPFLL